MIKILCGTIKKDQSLSGGVEPVAMGYFLKIVNQFYDDFVMYIPVTGVGQVTLKK